MNSKVYKCCAAPQCDNTSKTTPCKLFVYVPNNITIRSRWLSIARRDPTSFGLTSVIYFCEDHFDLPNDMKNYKQFKLMGSASQIRMKPGCVPTKFKWQTNTTKNRKYDKMFKKCVKNVEEKSTITAEHLELGDNSSKSSEPTNLGYITNEEYTSQDKYNEPDPTTLNKQALKITLARIRANPQLYIGIPKNCYHLIKILHKHTFIRTTYILLCLKKVKLDTHLEELADQFGISPDKASRIFIKNLPIISKALQSFVKFETQKNLSVRFRKYHSTIIDSLELNVQPFSLKSKELTQTVKGNTVKYLICRRPDGFINYVSSGYGGRLSNETVLEHTNYLNRFKPGTCFIANGFRNVEPILLEKGLKLVNARWTESKMCDKMQDPTSLIHSRKAVKRKRVTEMTQYPTRTSKKPFNDHMERVVNRVGEFSMVKGCSVVRSELVSVLDDAVFISCALINLQSFVIS